MGRSPLARFTRIKYPVARDEDLLVERVADETVVYDNRTKEAHCLSPLAAVVFAHCDGRTTVDQLAALATERLSEPVETPRVVDALSQLQGRDLLAVPPRDGLSRRQMIHKSAAAAAGVASVPLITTILAPTAAAQGTQFCDAGVLCRCCNVGTPTCPAIDPPNGNCSGGGQDCCSGRSCNCTKVGTESLPHCKPANAGANTCSSVANVCNCTGIG